MADPKRTARNATLLANSVQRALRDMNNGLFDPEMTRKDVEITASCYTEQEREKAAEILNARMRGHS